jgi:hypothetical protein
MRNSTSFFAAFGPLSQLPILPGRLSEATAVAGQVDVFRFSSILD